MARVEVRGADIVVRLSWWEQVAARRRQVRVPVAELRRAYVEPAWWRALRGLCGKGLWIPGRLCVGIRERPDGQDFAVVRADGPVLCVDLRQGSRFGRLAVSVPDPEEAMRALSPLVPRERLG